MAIAPFPVKMDERRCDLRGPGLNVHKGKFPIADLKAMQIGWVRTDVQEQTLTNDAVDELIGWYKGNALDMDWIVGSGVTNHAWNVPTASAQQICARYIAGGYRSPPTIELGNEVIQLNIPGASNVVFTVTAANATAGDTYTNNGATFTVGTTIAGGTTLTCTTATGDPAASGTLTRASGVGDLTITFSSVTWKFSTEALAQAAYATLMTSFKAAMLSNPHFLLGCNDETSYVKKLFDYFNTNGVATPDAWGIHGYSVYDSGALNFPGTADLMSWVTQSSIVVTESNYSAPTVSKANAKTFVEGMYGAMGTRPWCIYTGGDNTYNAVNNAYGWYSQEGAANANGLSLWGGRTATLTEIAADLGFGLP